jgi:microsomal dipeptidase-like Zn-dependent dipeptidase
VIRVYDHADNVIERGFREDNIEKILRGSCIRIFEELL